MADRAEHEAVGAPGVGSGIDASVPHSARIWNYWLGGKDYYAVDQQAGDAWLAANPQIAVVAREQRAFLRRVVRFLASEAGVGQFLDVGTGLPTAQNTHEVAQTVNPAARVVYVDNDPLVLAHARALLTSSTRGGTRYLHADMHEQATLLAGAAELLDLTEPVAVLFLGVLGHVTDTAQAHGLVTGLMREMPPGSYLAIADGHEPEATGPSGVAQAEQDYADTGAAAYHNRPAAEVAGFFTGLDWVSPGFVPMATWRPEQPGDGPCIGAEVVSSGGYGGLARKP